MLAIIPANTAPGAKRRLEPVLSLEERADLVATMLLDVVAACEAAAAVGRVLVVAPENGVAPDGVDVLRDRGRGHAAAVALALPHAPRAGVLVVMADCPLVTPAALDALAAAASPVAIGRAQDGGTNALALRPADVVEPAFGEPDGARVLAERARSAGVEARIVDDPGLAFDVDTVADLVRVLEVGDGTGTKAFLERVFAELTLDARLTAG